MSKPVFAYWQIRGLGESCRFLLYHVGVDFEDKHYAFGEGFAEAQATWFNGDKKALADVLDFPNLPYYIDGDVKITQSIVILRHLGRKHGLVGKNETDTLRIELAEQQIMDWLKNLAAMVHDHANFEKSKVARFEAFAKEAPAFAKFLGDRKFVAGDYLTYVDFLIYNTLDYYRKLEPSSLDGLDVLSSFLERIESLPNVAKYLASSAFPPAIFSPRAVWQGP